MARSYAYQVLIFNELERYGGELSFLEGQALTDDPQALLLVQDLITEYEHAKIAERDWRGECTTPVGCAIRVAGHSGWSGIP